MKAAKLFIDGIEYSNNLLFDFGCLEDSVGTYLYNIFDLTGYNEGDSFEFLATDKNDNKLISGVATVNFTPSVTVKVDDD